MDDVHLSGAAILVIGTLLTTLCTVVSFLFKLLLKAKDDQYADIKMERDNYRTMATEAINLLEEITEEHKRINFGQKIEDEKSDLKTRLSDLTSKLNPQKPKKIGF